MKRDIDGFEFRHVGSVSLKTTATSQIAEYVHQLPAAVRPNRYAAGPFCTFTLPRASHEAGVYAIIVGDEIKYIGECEDLDERFGPRGYGYVAARNCHHDGQATNCKVNARILEVSKVGLRVEVWFLREGNRKSIEAQLLSALAPPWNGTRSARRTSTLRGPRATSRLAGPGDFESALRSELASAQRAGMKSVRIRSGDLHRQVGGYPGRSHRMPVCCSAMKALMLPGDRIIASPPRGAGASLVVEYQLPRKSLSNT